MDGIEDLKDWPTSPGGTSEILNMSRAPVRVVLADMGSLATNIKCAANPQTLQVSVRATYGKLAPVGWSQQIVQYGSTESVAMPIELYFSAQQIWRFKDHSVVNIDQGVDFLASFLQPKGEGLAPPRLLLIWPKMVTIVLGVEEFQVTHSQFYRSLQASIATVTMQATEIETQFVSSGTRRSGGFRGGKEAGQNASLVGDMHSGFGKLSGD